MLEPAAVMEQLQRNSLNKGEASQQHTVDDETMSGSSDKCFFRFKVNIGGKKRRRGKSTTAEDVAGAESEQPSTGASAQPEGIERYLSKTKIKLQRENVARDQAQQNRQQLQSILKQHEDQLHRLPRTTIAPLIQRSLSDAELSLKSAGDTDQRAPDNNASKFDVASFLSEANASTVHPLGAGLFHKKRPRSNQGEQRGSKADKKKKKKGKAKHGASNDSKITKVTNGKPTKQGAGVKRRSSADEVLEEPLPVLSTQPASQISTFARDKSSKLEERPSTNHRENSSPTELASSNNKQSPSTSEYSTDQSGDRAAVPRPHPCYQQMRDAREQQYFPSVRSLAQPKPGDQRRASGAEVAPSSSSIVSTHTSPTMNVPSAFGAGLSTLALASRSPGARFTRAEETDGKVSKPIRAVRTAQHEVTPILPKDGRHLGFVAEGLQLMQLFEDYIWNYTPLHPSILHESSVRRILSGSEEDMGTPLALSVNIALAAASFLIGNSKRGNDFYRVARHHLAYLFDSSSYEVAEALVSMCLLAFSQSDLKRFGYYVHMAANICKRIGAYNSDIYAKCTIATAIDPLCTTEDKSRILEDYSSKAPLYPYYDSTRAIFPEHSDDVSFTLRSRQLYQRYVRVREADRHLSVSWLILKSWEEKANLSGAVRPMMYMDEKSLKQFLESLLRLEAIIEAEYLGTGFHETIAIYCLAERAQFHLMRGDDAKSWHWVSQFVSSLDAPRMAFLSPTTLPAYQALLDVLIHFRRPDLVRSVALSAQGWTNLHPICRAAADYYLQQADQIKPGPASIPTIHAPAELPLGLSAAGDLGSVQPHHRRDLQSSPQGRESGQDILFQKDDIQPGRESGMWSGSDVAANKTMPMSGEIKLASYYHNSMPTGEFSSMLREIASPTWPQRVPTLPKVDSTSVSYSEGQCGTSNRGTLGSFDWSVFLRDLEQNVP